MIVGVPKEIKPDEYRVALVTAGVETLVETGNTPVLLEGLNKGSLDLALLVSADLVEKRDYCVEMSWEFEMVLVSHLRHPPRPHLADLEHLRFILFRQGSRMQEPIDRYFATHGFEPNVIMRFDNSEFIRSMVRAGMGVSMLPVWVVDRDVKERRLTLIRQAEPPLYSKIALVRRKSKFVSRPVEACLATARHLEAKDLRLLTAPAPPRATSRHPRRGSPPRDPARKI